ncbi:MAG: HAD-IA family hydrolase [Bacilli bacterium]|jgi:phosphoglycolate phosphatase
MYKYAIFDIDGTIIDSLQDLCCAVNDALKNLCYDKVYTYEESKRLIGDGAYVLAQRAIAPFSSKKNDIDVFYEEYLRLYASSQEKTTNAFPHLKEVLNLLKDNGVSLMVFSNKPEPYANLILQKIFGPNMFDAIIGDRRDGHLKPDPFNLISVLKAKKIDKEETVYIGDGSTDIETSINAKIDMCLVTYGYGDYSDIDHAKIKYVASSPIKLLDIILH